MTMLIITRGISGSGKTTWAKNWVAQDSSKRARVNRDDLREHLFAIEGLGSFEQENLITIVQQNAVRSLLRKGLSVVVDDTHLRQKYITAWQDIAMEFNVGFQVNDSFVKTDLFLCMQRDEDRFIDGGRHVGKEIILKQYERLQSSLNAPIPEPEEEYKYTYDDFSYCAYMFDLDGTLAHMNGRSPYEWHRVGEDKLNFYVSEVLNTLAKEYSIIILSGRDSICRPETEKWLKDHNIPYNDLIMRKQGDNRKDSIVKLELFREQIANNYSAILGVFDDRQQVVDMWRRIGLTCFQVAPGEF